MRTKVSVTTGVSFLMGLMLLLNGCGTKNTKSPFHTSLVRGDVVFQLNGKNRKLTKGKMLPSGVIVETKRQANAQIMLNGNRSLWVNENTKIKMDYEVDEKNIVTTIKVSLQEGEIFTAYQGDAAAHDFFALSCPHGIVTGRESSFGVIVMQEKKVAQVASFGKQTSVLPSNGEGVDIGGCMKVMMNDSGIMSPAVLLVDTEYADLRQWIQDPSIDELIATHSCNQKHSQNSSPVQPIIPAPPQTIDSNQYSSTIEPQDTNQEPLLESAEEIVQLQWINQPKTIGMVKKPFVDTLRAEAGQGSKISYQILKAPEGFTIHKSKGIIHFQSEKTGKYLVSIKASDQVGNTVTKQYYLTITGAITCVLEMPQEAQVGEQVNLDAHKSMNSQSTTKGLVFRFDVNGDGKWDFPKKGTFAPVNSYLYTYDKTGDYTVKVEVRDKNSASSIVSKQIRIVPKRTQQVSLSVSPSFGTLKTEFTVSVTGLLKEFAPFHFQWDADGDGTYEIPGQSGTVSDSILTQSFNTPGVFTVGALITDSKGNNTSIAKPIAVFTGVSIDTLIAPDTVYSDQQFSIECKATDPDFPIIAYLWDFAGTGVSELKTSKSKVLYSYKKQGVYELVCHVKDKKGFSASSSKKLVVLRKLAGIDAGGPYKTFINKPVSVEGSCVDSSVALFEWFFTNGDKPDWQSPKTTKTECKFSHSGTMVIKLRAIMDDGKVQTDSALVIVENRPPVASAGQDIVSKSGKKVHLKGIGRDPDNNITQYEWDFDGDGNFDWVSSDTGYVDHEYTTYSYSILRVTDADATVSSDTLRIIICPEGMRTFEEEKFCMDIYEYPNQKGTVPQTQVTYAEASNHCKSKDKHLCTTTELKRACAGHANKRAFPYGNSFEPDKCNSFGNRHIRNGIAPSGEFSECESAAGIFDMSGNVAEWAESKSTPQATVFGGWWQDSRERASCNAEISMEKNKKYMHVGFRCCK